jgi:hypothetical protein
MVKRDDMANLSRLGVMIAPDRPSAAAFARLFPEPKPASRIAA